MADLTRDLNLRFDGQDVMQDYFQLDASSAQTIYAGQPIFLDANVDSTHARGYVAADTVAVADATLGVALAPASILATDTEGDAYGVHVIVSGPVGFPNVENFTLADLGKVVYWVDSKLKDTTAGGQLIAGPICRISDGYVYININAQGAPTINAGA